jgi:hypothetical protein
MEELKTSDISEISPELIAAIKELRDATPTGTAFPWSDMEVGDSILFQTEQGETLESIRAKIEASISQYMNFTGKKFTAKKMLTENGFRVWRRE